MHIMFSYSSVTIKITLNVIKVVYRSTFKMFVFYIFFSLKIHIKLIHKAWRYTKIQRYTRIRIIIVFLTTNKLSWGYIF